MVQLESLSRTILSDRDIRSKWLLGGLLLSLPFVNLLVFGYWLVYARRLLDRRSPQLPPWMHWEQILVDTLRMLGLYLAYALLPVLVCGAVSGLLAALFHLLWLDLLAWTVAWIPLMVAVALAPLTFLAATFAFVSTGGDWKVLLQPLDILSLIQPGWGQLVIPLLAFWGVAALGWPVAGFLIFLGFSILIPYAFSVFSQVSE